MLCLKKNSRRCRDDIHPLPSFVSQLWKRSSGEGMIKELIKYLVPYKKKVILGMLLLIISVVLEILIPRFLRDTIDELDRSPDLINLNSVYLLCAMILAIMLMRGIILFYTRLILISNSRRVEYDIRNQIFNKLLQLEPNFYHQYKTGDLISRMTSDLEQIRMMYGPGLMYTANVLFLFTLCFSSMLTIDTQLTFFAIIPLFLLAYLIKYVGSRYYEKSKLVQEEIAQMTTFVDENIQGIRVIKSYAKEAFALNLFQKINLSFIKKNLDLVKLSGLFRPILLFIVGISSIIILWVGGNRILTDKSMTLGQLIEFLTYIEMLGIPLMALGWVISIFQRGKSAYDRINEILAREPEIHDQNSFEDNSSINGNIVFKNLSFSYDTSNGSTLKDISFEINKGEKLAVIGPTGSGKTTLVSLLLRLYEAPANTIFIDNVPIQQYPLKTLRNNIGYVPQEDFVFPNSINENIRFGTNNGSDLARVIEVSKLAHLNQDIDLFPNRYDELIGERGITLSGGQRQRLGIARALSGNPKILIFDDSFSSIDSETENQILSNLHNYFTADETIILIAHRASTIRKVDRIVVLDYGRVVEIGSPEELIHLNGYYAHLLAHEKLSQDLNSH